MSYTYYVVLRLAPEFNQNCNHLATIVNVGGQNHSFGGCSFPTATEFLGITKFSPQLDNQEYQVFTQSATEDEVFRNLGFLPQNFSELFSSKFRYIPENADDFDFTEFLDDGKSAVFSALEGYFTQLDLGTFNYVEDVYGARGLPGPLGEFRLDMENLNLSASYRLGSIAASVGNYVLDVFDLAERTQRIAVAEDANKQLYVESWDVLTGFSVVLGGEFIGGIAVGLGITTLPLTAVAAGVGFVGTVIYTNFFRDSVRDDAANYYDQNIAPFNQPQNAPLNFAPDKITIQSMINSIVTADNPDLIRFDETWYLSEYADALVLVNDGTYNSGYEHFHWLGVDLGYSPNESGIVITRNDIAIPLANLPSPGLPTDFNGKNIFAIDLLPLPGSTSGPTIAVGSMVADIFDFDRKMEVYLLAGDDLVTFNRFGQGKVSGGSGNDTFQLGTSINSASSGPFIEIFGDNGLDTLDGSNLTSGLTIDTKLEQIHAGHLGTSISQLYAKFFDVENIIGTNFFDLIIGDEGNNEIHAGGGNDFLNGGGGDDLLDGGGDDDTVIYIDANSAVNSYLQFTGRDTGGAGIDTLISIENLTGSAFDDRLVGDANDNVLTGGDGIDILKGKGGNDTFFGGAGDDKLTGGVGDDIMFGGAGSDRLIALDGLDTLNGGDDDDFLFGGKDSDVLNGDAGADNIRGNLGVDVLNGGTGSDTLRGGGSNDTLNGGDDNDFLFGENHSDTLFGGAGNDSLTGGLGLGAFDGFTDTFIYKATGDGGGGFDRIKDFENGIDVMDLQSFGFANFAAVQALTSDSGVNMRINFGGGDVLFVENFQLADFDAGDVLLA